VLSKFRPEELKEMETSAANAYECLKLMVNGKTDEAMNKYNA
jgi:PTH1 family peptidyl-tRNA hydrolase